MDRRWTGDGKEMDRKWKGDGKKMDRRWKGEGRLRKGDGRMRSGNIHILLNKDHLNFRMARVLAALK